MEIIKGINATVAFLLEIGMLAALGYAGFQADKPLTKWLLGLGLPLVVIIIWGLFAAPNSNQRLDQPFRTILELALMGLAAFLLYRTGQHRPAIVFATLAVVSEMLALIWRQ